MPGRREVTAATVLVVEDEQLVAKGIRQALMGFGYEVPEAVASGEHAVRRAEELRPGLVLMDIALEGWMDGVAAAAEIRARLGIPVVYLTSHADEETRARAAQAGAYGYLVKPFDVHALRTAVEVALEKRDLERRVEATAAAERPDDLEARPVRSEARIALGGKTRGNNHEINNALAYVISNVAFSAEGVREIVDKLSTLRVPKVQRGELGDVLTRLRDIGDALDDAGEGADRVLRLVRGRGAASSSPSPGDRLEGDDAREGVTPSARARLLVIDDDAAVAAAMARLLGLHHDVAIETDPIVALARLGGPEWFDVVFCDLMMPSGSGMELYEKVAASAPHVAARVVFMTGGVFTEEAGTFLERVPNARLTKPFTLEAVQAIVTRWLPREGESDPA
jgi:CheY-like chemotaxis protein